MLFPNAENAVLPRFYKGFGDFLGHSEARAHFGHFGTFLRNFIGFWDLYRILYKAFYKIL